MSFASMGYRRSSAPITGSRLRRTAFAGSIDSMPGGGGSGSGTRGLILKADTARPPAATERRQQQRFDSFRAEWNVERPHEALGQRPPAMVWEPSAREYPEVLPKPEYPSHFEARRIKRNGRMNFKGRTLFVSESLAGELVGLVEVDDGVWSISFVGFEVGRLDQRTWTIY